MAIECIRCGKTKTSYNNFLICGACTIYLVQLGEKIVGKFMDTTDERFNDYVTTVTSLIYSFIEKK